MVRDYISKVEYIQALQYNEKNSNEILNWLGSQYCYLVGDNIRVVTSNKESSVELIKGDYVLKKSNGVFKIMSQKAFEDIYHLLPVGLEDSFNMLVNH